MKTPEEIAELEAAVTTSVAMHEAAMRLARPGVREAEIAAEVERIALAAGGRTAFPVIGTVRGIWETGAPDVLVVEDADGAEHLIPAAEALLLEVDIEGGRIVVDAIPGLVDEPGSR